MILENMVQLQVLYLYNYKSKALLVTVSKILFPSFLTQNTVLETTKESKQDVTILLFILINRKMPMESAGFEPVAAG